MAPQDYAGIRFPDRAESLNDFTGYKIFLEPWEPLAADLRRYYEGLALRREARVLAVHGAQGIGKTMFATQLLSDFNRTKQGEVSPDADNLWHRVVGGADLSAEHIREATLVSDVLVIEDDAKWTKTAETWVAARTDRRLMIIADNAERAYFRQGLVEMSDVEFIGLSGKPELTTMAAQRLVALCRTTLRGCLLVVLSNDDVFLLNMDEAVQAQHAGLMTLTSLPVPDAQTKETVVRVNTNRLNGVSYWYCLDKAGPVEKRSVKQALEGASTFPDSFAAVDAAIRSADAVRMGRPARQNHISLLVLSNEADLAAADVSPVGQIQRVEASHARVSLTVFNSGWAPEALGEREGRLLESEWNLRLCLVGPEVVRSLVVIAEGADATGAHLEAWQRLIELLSVHQGPGTHATTREAYTEEWQQLMDAWPSSEIDLSEFWTSGQVRSRIYEGAMREISPGYDTGGDGFAGKRPDIVVSPFRPCSIVNAVSDEQEAINAAIRRDAHVIEVTAQQSATMKSIADYMAGKFTNYVFVTQEQ